MASDGRLYVANFGSNTVSIHDPLSGALLRTIGLSGSPSLVLAFADSVWVTRQTGDSGLVALDSGGDIIYLATEIPAGARDMVGDPRSHLLYVSHPALHKIFVFGADTRELTATFNLASANPPGAPYALEIDTGNDRLFAIDAGRSLLYILDLLTGQVLGSLPVGAQTVEHGGQGLVYLDGRLYVANDADKSITVFTAGPCSAAR